MKKIIREKKQKQKKTIGNEENHKIKKEKRNRK